MSHVHARSPRQIAQIGLLPKPGSWVGDSRGPPALSSRFPQPFVSHALEKGNGDNTGVPRSSYRRTVFSYETFPLIVCTYRPLPRFSRRLPALPFQASGPPRAAETFSLPENPAWGKTPEK